MSESFTHEELAGTDRGTNLDYQDGMKKLIKRPRFRPSDEQLHSLRERAREFECLDLGIYEVEQKAFVLLSELRALGLKFDDLAKDEEGCLACLSFSLASALTRLCRSVPESLLDENFARVAENGGWKL